MQVQEVVDYLLDKIKTRKEIFDVAIDRGKGYGMQIEKWILIEMLSRLKELKVKGRLSKVEGEHKFSERKYEDKKTSRYEHCDLWWIDNNDQENWLEVKTIVFPQSGQLGKYTDITIDLAKEKRINTPHVFYHLTFLFPINPGFNNVDFHKAYEGCEFIKSWLYDIGCGKSLNILLYKSLN